MTEDTETYLADQLALFEGGYQHIMVELTAHLTGTGDTVPIGVKITDHPTGELVAYQVPVIVGNLRQTDDLVTELVRLLWFVRGKLSPF